VQAILTRLADGFAVRTGDETRSPVLQDRLKPELLNIRLVARRDDLETSCNLKARDARLAIGMTLTKS
jgi:hypothetical protein